MSSRFFRWILPFLSLLALIYLAYGGFKWWQKDQKQKQLFTYLLKDSPATKRIPSDAIAYLNLYDIQRLYGDWKGTRFYDVLAHWLDTGLSGKEKANPLLGGMLEKTILNVLGNELVLAAVPGKTPVPDLIGIARISSGSDFLLNLLLSSAKNVEKSETDGFLIYSLPLKNSGYEKIYVTVEDPLAYVSTNLQRLLLAAAKEGSGPDMLKNVETRSISEDTFLILYTPEASATGYGGNHTYHFTAESSKKIEGLLPEFRDTPSQVLKVRTNSTSLFRQPSACYSLQNVDGMPVSALMLGFQKPETAGQYEANLFALYQKENGANMIEQTSDRGIHCYRSEENGIARAMCRKGPNLLLVSGAFDPEMAEFATRKRNLPLILSVDFNSNSIPEYKEFVQKKDWKRFQHAKGFYFLSCIRELEGNIDEDSELLTVQIE